MNNRLHPQAVESPPSSVRVSPVGSREGGGSTSSLHEIHFPECECSSCGNVIKAGERRISNKKSLKHLSRRAGGEITGQICAPCITRIRGTRDWALSGSVSVMTGTLKKIDSGEIPSNISSIFNDLDGVKATVEKSLKSQLKKLDKLTAEYSAIQSSWLSVRKAYGDYLWQTYPERRKRANRAISQEEIRFMVFSRDEYRCRLCNSGEKLEVDHVIPVVKGGDDDPENLQTLCRRCNRRKGGN